MTQVLRGQVYRSDASGNRFVVIRATSTTATMKDMGEPVRVHVHDNCYGFHLPLVGMTLEAQPNARFWAWVNMDYVKIILKPNQVLSHVEGGPTDEGWSYHATCWDHEGDRVTREYTSNACDCDGRLDRYYESECLLEDLRGGSKSLVDEAIVLPKWQRVSASQRDHEAERAGY